MSLIPGSGRSPSSRHGNPLQNCFLDNPADRGAWWATGHSVAKNWTGLKQLSMHARNATCARTSTPSLYDSQEATNSINAGNPRCLTSLPINFLLRIPVPLHFYPSWFCSLSPLVASCCHILNSLRRQAALNFITSLRFFYEDHFLSLYWICYNIVSVLCFVLFFLAWRYVAS